MKFPFDYSTIVGRLVAGSTITFFVRIAGSGLGFLVHMALANHLGTFEYGIYAMAFAWASILTLPSALGTDHGVVRLLPKYIDSKQWGKASGLLRDIFLITGVLGLVFGLLMGGGMYFLWDDVHTSNGSVASIVWLIIIFLPLNAFVLVSSGVYRALCRVGLAYGTQNIMEPSITLLSILGMSWYFGELNAGLAMTCKVAGMASALLLFFLLFPRFWPSEIKTARIKNDLKGVILICWPMFLVTGTLNALSQTDILMVGSLIGSDAAGLYSAGVRIATLATLVIMAVNGIAMPMISQYHARNEQENLVKLVRYATIGTFGLTVPLVLMLFFFGDWVLGLLGSEFSADLAAMRILLIGRLITGSAAMGMPLLLMTGHQKVCAKIFLFSIPVNLALNMILIPHWGIEGAATATVVTILMWNVWVSILVMQKLGINPFLAPLPKSMYIRTSAYLTKP